MKTLLFRPLDNWRAACLLCGHQCVLTPGRTGLCGVRQGTLEDGKPVIQSFVLDRAAACHVDPVEKKPLYHYLPGSLTFSLGTEGCNFDCSWCQNDSISRRPAETGQVRGVPVSPEGLVTEARNLDCASLAFTYTEPTVFFELMLATATLARDQGLGTVMVSNGFQSPACLEQLTPVIQAANIDLKAFRDATYRKYCQGRLTPVLDTLKHLKKAGVWLEVTTLVIPGINDDPAEFRDMASFIRAELGADTPWHVSAFRPCRHMAGIRPTPPATLMTAWETGRKEGLRFVYAGNMYVPGTGDTRCPACTSELLIRKGFGVSGRVPFDGVCPVCGEAVAGYWANDVASREES